MNAISMAWMIVFAIASLLFFGAAVIITVIGTKDLKNLLSRSEEKEPSNMGPLQ